MLRRGEQHIENAPPRGFEDLAAAFQVSHADILSARAAAVSRKHREDFRHAA